MKLFLRKFYRKYKTDGYVAQFDIHGYYPNMRHDVAEENFRRKLPDWAYKRVEAILRGQYKGEVAKILQFIVGGIEVRAIKVQTLLSEKAEMENALAQANVAAGRCEKLVDDIVFVTLCESGMIDDVTATEHTNVFAEWASGVSYAVGNIRTYGEKLYKCVQAHTSQADWTPDVVPALWTRIGDPAEEWPEWSQPIGAHDAYQIGDKVSYNAKHWVSNTANNVWQPGVYGWDESA